MAYSPSNLEIQGSYMRVPPPKELTKSLERRRSSEESQKATSRRSTTVNSRPSPPKKPIAPATNPSKIETKSTPIKSDETEQMKTKISNLEDEIRRLKKRIEELEKEVAELQKQLRTKDKRISELTKENEELKKRVTSPICSSTRILNDVVLFEGIQLPKTIGRISFRQSTFR